MIQLTDSDKGTVMYVRPSEIRLIWETGAGDTMIDIGGNTYYVKESPSEIYNMMFPVVEEHTVGGYTLDGKQYYYSEVK